MARAINVVSTTSSASPGSEADANDESMDLVVSQIRQICRDSSLEFALRVGAVVIHNFYGGNVNAWRTRGPKVCSFRRLSRHAALPMSPAALYRCVAVFELCERLNAPSRWRRLGASHFRTVLGLEAAEQEKLLTVANKERWTVKTLQAAALEQRTIEKRRGGRRPKSVLAKNLSLIRRSLPDCDSDLENHLRSLDQESLEQAAVVLTRTRDWIEHLCQIVERYGGPVTPPDESK